jgi:hypothetical protein
MAAKCLVEYNHVGKSGLKVANICLGTMTFGKVDSSPFAVSIGDREIIQGSHSLYNVLTWVALFSLHFNPRFRSG